MKNFSIAFIVFVIWTFFALWLYSFLKSPDSFAWINIGKEDSITNTANANKLVVDQQEDKQIDSITPAAVDTTAVVVNQLKSGLYGKTQKDDIVFYFEQGLTFKKNDSIVQTTVSNLDYKYKVLSYLVEHPDTEVVVHSRYSPTEDINTPNFGVIRGEFIKEDLINAGITRNRIVVKSEIFDIPFNAQDEYSSGFDFRFKPLDLARVAALKSAVPESQLVYPNFSNSGITVNQELKDLLELIKLTLKERPETTVKIIGHTDNIGNYQDNYNTGLKYARQVRWYLVQKGNLDRKIITALSKGEAEPIDSNNSERGRNANRRIEVIFN